MVDVKPNLTKQVSLKENFLQILISPRVREIPVRYQLTVFVFSLIAAFSAGAVVLYRNLYSQEICAATPVPFEDENDAERVCEELLVRKDVEYNVDINFRWYESGRANVELFISKPEKFEYELLHLGLDQLNQLSQATDFYLDNVFFLNQGIQNVPRFDFKEFIEVTQGGAFNSWVDNVEYRFESSFGDTGIFEGAVDGFGLGDGESSINNRILQNATSADFLFIEYHTTAGTRCQTEAEVFFGATGLLKTNCKSSGNGDIFKLQWTNDKESDILLAWYGHILQLHSNQLGASQSCDGGGPCQFIDFVLIKLLRLAFGFCCENDDLDFFESFGLISGFGFALEGVITFAVATTLFRNKLGLNRSIKSRSEEDEWPDTVMEAGNSNFAFSMKDAASKELEYDEFGEEPAKIDKQDEVVEQDSDYEDSNDKSMVVGFSTNGVKYSLNEAKTVSVKDIKRAIFNPRCENVPYASTISLSAFLMLMLVSAALAGIVMTLRTKRLCSAVDYHSVTERDVCDTLQLEAFTYYDSLNEKVGSVNMKIQLEIGSGPRFDIESLRLSDGDLVTLQANCLNGTFGNGTTCFNYTGSPFVETYNFAYEDVFYGEKSVEINYETADSNGQDVYTFLRYQEKKVVDTGNSGAGFDIVPRDEITIQYQIQLCQNFEGNFGGCDRLDVFLDVSTEYRFNQNFSVFDSGIVSSALFSAIGDDVIINSMLSNAFARCCKPVSLGYLEYLGLLIGYMTLAEGLLTFLTAYVVYNMIRVIKCKNRFLQYFCRFLPVLILVLALIAVNAWLSSEKNDEINDANYAS